MLPFFKAYYQASIKTKQTQSPWMKSMLLCTILLVAFPHLSQADRVEIQAIGPALDLSNNAKLEFFPGAGIGYEFRNPSDRAGWSLLPYFIHVTHKKETYLSSLFLPSILGKYRYYFNRHFSIDFNAGGGLGIMPEIHYHIDTSRTPNQTHANQDTHYLPVPLVLIGFHYSFDQGLMLGTNLTALYAEGSILPAITLQCSLPIAKNKVPYYKKQHRSS